MDQQFLAAFRQLIIDDFNAVFPDILAGRLWRRYLDAREVDELQLYLLSLTDEQQLMLCKLIKTKMHPQIISFQGPDEALKAFRDFLLDHNLHFIIKNDIALLPDRSHYADWAIITDTDHYLRWLKYVKGQKAA